MTCYCAWAGLSFRAGVTALLLAVAVAGAVEEMLVAVAGVLAAAAVRVARRAGATALRLAVAVAGAVESPLVAVAVVAGVLAVAAAVVAVVVAGAAAVAGGMEMVAGATPLSVAVVGPREETSVEAVAVAVVVAGCGASLLQWTRRAGMWPRQAFSRRSAASTRSR